MSIAKKAGTGTGTVAKKSLNFLLRASKATIAGVKAFGSGTREGWKNN